MKALRRPPVHPRLLMLFARGVQAFVSLLRSAGTETVPDDLARFHCRGPTGHHAWGSKGPHRFLGDPSRTSALLSDPGRAPRPSHHGPESAAPASSTTKAPTRNSISRPHHTASVPAAYASNGALPAIRKARFRLVAGLCREGVEPSGSLRKVSERWLMSSLVLLSQASPVADWIQIQLR